MYFSHPETSKCCSDWEFESFHQIFWAPFKPRKVLECNSLNFIQFIYCYVNRYFDEQNKCYVIMML